MQHHSISADGLKDIKAKLANYPAIRSAIVPEFRQGLTDVLQAMHAELPHGKTGDIVRGTQVHFNGDLSGEISTSDAIAPHAKYVYLGTRAHKVEAVRAKALQWFVGGQVRYAQSIIVPAKKPNPYLDRLWKKHEPEFVKRIEEAVASAIG